MQKILIKAVILLAVVMAVYIPAMRGGYIFDDDLYLLENPVIHASDGLSRIWLKADMVDYTPVLFSDFWLEWRLWKGRPAGFHIVNIILHAGNVLLLWMVLRMLKIPGAWLAALLFAVHPVNAATAAWISERKNTLSAVFFLSGMAAYFRFEDRKRAGYYVLAVMAFLLALLTKPTVVMMPVVILGCLWWFNGRVTRKDVVRTLPFFTLSLIAGLVAVGFQWDRAMGGTASRADDLWVRAAVAGRAVWFYLEKTFIPAHLALIYPKWNMTGGAVFDYAPLVLLALLFAGLWLFRNAWSRAALFALGYYVVMLFPMLGFFDQGFYRYSYVADHWQYLSLMGLTALAGAALFSLSGKRNPTGWFARGFSVALVGVLWVLTWQRAGVYADADTLYRDTLAKNPAAYAAYYNLGLVLLEKGRADEAAGCFRNTLMIKEDQADAWYNLGKYYFDRGDVNQAETFVGQALRYGPRDIHAHSLMANILAMEGKMDMAVGHLLVVIEEQPDDSSAYNNLGMLFYALGRVQDARTCYEKAISLNSPSVSALVNMGQLYLSTGDTVSATAYFEKALKLSPGLPAAEKGLTKARIKIPGN